LIRRGEVRPFSEAHISLLQTFADQAVIAIENVRLFEPKPVASSSRTWTCWGIAIPGSAIAAKHSFSLAAMC
jgi:hypothetical protein